MIDNGSVKGINKLEENIISVPYWIDYREAYY